MDRHLSPTETAKRFGVSVKALRLYEQRGLLTPLRSEAGWRTYGPVQIARLHQILALKRLGLPLARIGELLDGADNLDAVLALQEQTLARQSEQLSRAMALVRTARGKLASGTALSIDDLATLTKETVMTKLNAKELNRVLMPFADRHISTEEKEALKAKLIDRDQVAKDFDELIAEAQALMQVGDPTSPAAQDLARRWTTFAGQIKAAADPNIAAKGRSIWNDAMEDPATAGKLALNREIFQFVDRAIAHLIAVAK